MPKDFQQEVERIKNQLIQIQDDKAKVALMLRLNEEFVSNAGSEIKPFLQDGLRYAEETGDLPAAAQLAKWLANIYLWQGDNESSRDYALRVLEFARKANDPQMEASGNFLLATVYEAGGKYDEAEKFCLQALKIWHRGKYQRNIYAALNQLGNLAGLQGKFEQAVRYYQECGKVLASTEFDDFARAANYCNLGWVFLQQGRWDDAEENLYRAVAIAEERGYEHLRWHAITLLGELFLKQDRLQRAEEMFMAVVDAGRQGHTPLALLCDGLTALGEVHFRQHNFGVANRIYTEALTLCQQANDLYGAGEIYWRIAELECTQGQLNRCQGFCNQALAIAQQIGGRTIEAEAFRVLGLMEAKNGMAAAATSYFKKALALLSEIPESYATARLRLQYGKFLPEQGEKEAGERELDAAGRVFKKLGSVAESEEVNRLLFRYETGTDRTTAMLSAIANLATMGLEPMKFVSQSLRIIREAFGYDGAALLIEGEPRVIEGRLDARAASQAAGTETLPAVSERMLCFPVSSAGEVLGLIYLERAEPKAPDFRPQVLETVAAIIIPAVQRLKSFSKELPAPAVEIPGLCFSGVIGKSAVMRRNLEIVARSANSSVPVLIRGESGTGKELVARAIHNSGARRDKPFVAINCAAVPETLLEAEFFGVEKGAATGVLPRKGKFELADGGTVFLDEVGDMSPALQTKLLRVLQEKEFERIGGTKPVKVDIRIVAATNQNIETLIEQGRFRPDLFYRLNGVEISLPPLRDRKEDIPELVRYFVAQANLEANRQVTGVSKEVMDCFLVYGWPGNIRQLQHVIQRAVVLSHSDELQLEDLPAEFHHLALNSQERNSQGLRARRRMAKEKAAAEIERSALVHCLEQAAGNVTKAAELAGYSRAQFYRLLKKHNLHTRNRPV